jgi:hypothetical protein
MNDIDRYLDQACRSVNGPIALRKHLREELKEHLEDAISELMATGMSQNEATEKVIEDFGEPEMIREGLQSVYGQSVTALFIDKAMDWKERTMKTEWKWTFTAQLGLLLIIALAVFMIGSALVFIVPVVVHSYHTLGMTLPNYVITMINVADFLIGTLWIWLIALAGGVALFEWKCRSDNKSLIRIVAGVGTSVIFVALAFWVAAAIVIPLVQVRRAAFDQQNESLVAARIIEAHESYQQLAQAIEEENWPAANELATEVRDAYRFLRDMGTTTVVLSNESGSQSPGEIRRLTAEIADISDDLHDAIRDEQEEATKLEYFTLLKASYANLETESPFFANRFETDQ